MPTPKWQAGKLYLPGDLVQPKTAQAPVSTAITNAGFEDDATDWNLGFNTSIRTGYGYAGNKCLEFIGNSGETQSFHDPVVVMPGKKITASFMYQQGPAPRGQNGAKIQLRWFDSAMVEIRTDSGTVVNDGSGGAWHQSTITAIAPALSCFVSVGLLVDRTQVNGPSQADQFTWDYATVQAPAGLIYKAVQEGPGTSASTEPVWPLVNGEQVVDNTVIWEAVLASRVTWTASPILKSGPTEPVWPTSVGGFVADGTISWQCVSRRVEDVNCPNTKVVQIIASKVFAVDGDIVRFSATANPLDWSSEKDSGYLPTGLQSANANDMTVLGQYRGNLVAMNPSSFQNWQVDPDPTAMALLDQREGIGSSYNRAAQPVGNELFFLPQLGVRSVGRAAGTDSLAAGDIGMPIDSLIQEALAVPGVRPLGTYYPGSGQFWLAMRHAVGAPQAPTQVFVYTLSGGSGKWSRYTFPWSIEEFAQLGDDLYVRHGDFVSRVDPVAVADDVAGVPVNFASSVWWPWLDFAAPGVTKMLQGIDYIGLGQGPTIAIGYDERNVAAFTAPYQLSSDTLPGGIIPMAVSAPSFSVKLSFAGGQKWTVNAVNVMVTNLGNGP